jgi:hypothetical protein
MSTRVEAEVRLYAMVRGEDGDTLAGDGNPPDFWNVYLVNVIYDDNDNVVDLEGPPIEFDHDFDTQAEAEAVADFLARMLDCEIDHWVAS